MGMIRLPSMNTLIFDVAAHKYILDGRILPSVTRIINAVIPMRFRPDQWYLDRGTALHAAIHLAALGKLDRSSIDPAYEGKMDAFHRFIFETGATMIENEVRLASSRFGYAGTYDALIRLRGKDVICDWKGNVSPVADLQIGAYSLLRSESRAGARDDRGVAIQLNDDGSYVCRWVKDLRRAEQAFLAVLSTYNWMKTNNMLPSEQKEVE